MIQTTSLQAYNTQVLPKLGKKQSAVYRIFRNVPRPDFTDKELGQILGWPINEITPRRGELKKKGLIVEAGERGGCTTWRDAFPKVEAPKSNQTQLAWK